MVEALVHEDVDFIFGYPGGAVLPLYDTFYDEKIKHILARHEQGATHAAEGYARVSGKPGVVVVTSGPELQMLSLVLLMLIVILYP